MKAVLLIDFGSTYTKVTAVDVESGVLLGTADSFTTIQTDIGEGLSNALEKEVQSIHIGELAMDELRRIDEVAYIRFASVYREFKDINTFMNELSKLMSERNKK